MPAVRIDLFGVRARQIACAKMSLEYLNYLPDEPEAKLKMLIQISLSNFAVAFFLLKLFCGLGYGCPGEQMHDNK